ncbi:D-glycerate dehydrogenase [Pigmentiphaga soli]|uniref:D-glycerate dehydrogenase n=1 Tax=Pigmentiphaga soli TaxID=1007095 RepID=A0ABP8GPL5_9BURK
MSRPVVAITRRLFPDSDQPLQSRAEVRLNPADTPLVPARMVEYAAGCQALVATAGCQVPAEVIEGLPGLKLIANVGVGYNNIDVAAANRAGVMVTNTPDVLTEATADMAWALLLGAARRTGESERWLRDGKWNVWGMGLWLGADVHGATLGIIGMGRIGRAIARRASGFGMQVLYHNRRELPAEESQGARWVGKEELLRSADHVVLVVPYSPATHHIVGAPELALMKPTAVLVNIGRGGLVDDRALAQALQEGRIAAAGLDVFEGEPKVAPELLAAPNALLTPHIGSATSSARRAMADLAIANVVDWLDGKRPRTLVNPEVLTGA